MRQYDYWNALRADSGWKWKNSYSWYAETGFYIKEFGDMVSSSAINGANDREFEFTGIARFTPFKSRYWIYNVVNETMLGSWKSDSLTGGEAELFWQQRFGLEFVLRQGNKGALLFADLYFDEMPIIDGRKRFSKDKLLQFGFRFFI